MHSLLVYSTMCGLILQAKLIVDQLLADLISVSKTS